MVHKKANKRLDHLCHDLPARRHHRLCVVLAVRHIVQYVILEVGVWLARAKDFGWAWGSIWKHLIADNVPPLAHNYLLFACIFPQRREPFFFLL